MESTDELIGEVEVTREIIEEGREQLGKVFLDVLCTAADSRRLRRKVRQLRIPLRLVGLDSDN